VGKGNYNGTVAESIMYWTTSSGFDVDITEFVKSEEKKRIKPTNYLGYYWTATVTFKDYSYEIETTHFNINILAESIKEHLIEIKHPDFSYKIDHHNPLTQKYFEELHYKFGYDVKREETVYNPVRNHYTTRYQIVTKDTQWKYRDVFYTHQGDMEDYVEGSIFKFIVSQCDKDLYKADYKHTGLAKRVESVCKKGLSTKRIEVDDTFYSISGDHFIQPFIIGSKKFEFITPTKEPHRNEIKDFLKKEAIEYII
jgi:hypothetical protein